MKRLFGKGPACVVILGVVIHLFAFKITTWALKGGIGWDGSDMGLPSKGSRKNS